MNDGSEIRSHGREIVEFELGGSLFVDIVDKSGESFKNIGDEERIGESGLYQRFSVVGGRKEVT